MAYAEVTVRGDFQCLGGARGRRRVTRYRNFNRPSQSSVGSVGGPGNLMWRSACCFRPHPGADQRPRASRAAGIRHGQGDQPARAHLSSPRTQGTGGGGATAYAEVVVRGDVQRRGGARERRASVAVRRRWERIRSITRGWVMKATARISCPQRGHRSGSTSKIPGRPFIRAVPPSTTEAL